ncbi:unnamed protein product [Nezara viridula]|uniref:Neuropeptide n=1 Tax=Nezara viridula TaxID=85310 RepID=A0A9P0HGN4_NEZVI|nr:unnamed protein product [Nezara viridula]
MFWNYVLTLILISWNFGYTEAGLIDWLNKQLNDTKITWNRTVTGLAFDMMNYLTNLDTAMIESVIPTIAKITGKEITGKLFSNVSKSVVISINKKNRSGDDLQEETTEQFWTESDLMTGYT